MARVCFIVNSYNRAALLKQSLESIARNLIDTRMDVSVVIFDAGSTDGSREIIEAFRHTSSHGKVHVIYSLPGEDSSFAAGLNRACAARLATGEVDYFFTFETDNFMDGPEPLLRAIALLETRPEIAAVGFTVRRRNGSATGFGERFPGVLSFLVGQQFAHTLHLDAPRVAWQTETNPIGRFAYADVVFTSPLLIRSTVWTDLGGMDAGAFPFSDSDLDLAFRICKVGKRMAVLEEDRVYHDNLGQASEWSAARTLRFHQARYLLLSRHRTRMIGLLKPLLFARHLLEYLLLLTSTAARHDHKPQLRLRLLRGVWSGYQASSS